MPKVPKTTNLQYLCNISGKHKEWSWFLPADNCQRFLQSGTIILDVRLEQITFCQCTNFRVHEDVCSAWSCTQKLCNHVVVVHWSKNISKNAPLPGWIQKTDKNQPSMSYVNHCHICCFLKQYHVSRSNIGSYVQATCFVLRELLACFCFGCGRAILGPWV